VTTERLHRVALIPGDGVGAEVTDAACPVLDAATAGVGACLEWTELDWGCARYLEEGAMLPEDGLERLRGFHAILLGAVGHPSVPDHTSLWGLLVPIRRAFGQYVNLRPVKLFPGVISALADRNPADVDLVIVRENSEGEYSQIGGRHDQGTEAEFALQESVFTRRGVGRIVRFAFELARTRRHNVVAATKSNGIVHTMPFWDEVARSVAAEYPDVAYEQVHVDALAARMVLAPQSLDVVVGSNLFADILSDLAAAIAGGLGLAPSANLNPSSEFPSMFEPVHGSAPDIAGRGIANPIAQVLSGAMMLRHLGEAIAADRVERAVAALLAEGSVRTVDLGGTSCTAAVGTELVRLVKAAS
jgi:tartrate dehydrogenase/decarboxylase/D-malate dehydrogenase